MTNIGTNKGYQMDVKKFIFAAFALFVFIFFYEWFVHAYALKGLYNLTPTTWRSYPEMEANMPLAIFFQFLFAVWTAFVFTRLYKHGGIKNGLKYGLYFGVFAALLTSNWYLWINVPSILGLYWFLFGLLEGLIAGLILGLVYNKGGSCQQC